MKHLTLIASLLAAGTTFASAETVIFDVTASAGTYVSSSIYALGDKEQSGSDVSFSINGGSSTVSLKTGWGTARGFLDSAANWDSGLPGGIGSALGISDQDISTIAGSAVYATGNTSGYPGKIEVTFSGLSAGKYDLSGLMAKKSGDTSPTTWSVTINGQAVSPSASYYSYNASTSAWNTETTSGNSYDGVANNTKSGYYVSLAGIELTQQSNTLVLTLSGTPAQEYSMNCKTLQFVALTTSAVPEPSAFGLLAGVGALAFVAARRCRRKVA